MTKPRIDTLTPDTPVILAVGHGARRGLWPATFIRVVGKGDDRLAEFVWQKVADEYMYRWSAHRFEGRWVFGSDQTPISLHAYGVRIDNA